MNIDKRARKIIDDHISNIEDAENYLDNIRYFYDELEAYRSSTFHIYNNVTDRNADEITKLWYSIGALADEGGALVNELEDLNNDIQHELNLLREAYKA